MTTFVDISARLRPGMPCWPGSPGFDRSTTARIEDGDHVQDSTITMDAHVGTHLDAPRHYLRDGRGVDEVDLDALVGPARVVDVHAPVVTGAALAAALGSHRPSRLLIRTANGRHWPDGDAFEPNFVALDESAAQWCVDHGVRLVGIDHLSIQSPSAGPETHRILLRAGIVVLEGLDLRLAPPGEHELLCLPLLVEGAEGAPARAVLRPLGGP